MGDGGTGAGEAPAVSSSVMVTRSPVFGVGVELARLLTTRSGAERTLTRAALFVSPVPEVLYSKIWLAESVVTKNSN